MHQTGEKNLGRPFFWNRRDFAQTVAGTIGLAVLNTTPHLALAQESAQESAGSQEAAKAEKSVGSDWPAFLGPTGDGKSTETGLLAKWPVEGPKVLWTLAVGTGYGIGSVSEGRFYQFDKVEGKARLQVVDAATGVEKWSFSYPSSYADLYGYDDGPRCSPVLDGDRVYLYGVEGMLHCLSKKDGEVHWKVDTAKDYGVIQNFFGVGSTPVIYNDLLIVMVGGSPPESAQVAPGQLDLVEPNRSAVIAFDKKTGKERYRVGNDLASYASMKVVRADGKSRDRDWGLAFCRGGLVAFDPSSGKLDFQFPFRDGGLESVNASMPVVVGDEVFLSETYGPGSVMLKLNKPKPTVVWQDKPFGRAKAMQTHWNTAIEHNGFLYGSSGRHTGNAELRCIEWATEKVRWSIPRLTRASLTYAEEKFYVMCEDGRLLLIEANPEKFTLISEFDLSEKPFDPDSARPSPLLGYPCWAAPVLSHGRLYVRGAAGRGQGRVVCLDVKGA